MSLWSENKEKAVIHNCINIHRGPRVKSDGERKLLSHLKLKSKKAEIIKTENRNGSLQGLWVKDMGKMLAKGTKFELWDK